ncbi:peptidyl-prolyl cis-trans isomerase [Aliivibrio fischeri ES114]|uniref:Peptidyl-prolyl cis-trans isomerase n=1 Tax=Aliivibrio fischeri (strain ATCC 700601 / ES114) TaxID=312309 RepID=Q5E6Y0_ALIF1|nr:peptidylprolyl isomerase [Aliivibrio fischeri]AAW85216.1 peptidyl-prolyl cis-trans isomerase [Aliivibrio fischeri ES114]KLU77748.1 peptidyl-prolyl cis-trans isomerase [Aliivibrio fischeri]
MIKMISKAALIIAALSTSQMALAESVKFETTLGNFTVELNSEKAPISVANFIRYVEDGSYVGTQFHRVIPGFMAQGGGFDKNMIKKPSYGPIKNEGYNGLGNDTATIAMARTNNPDSATRQFYINLNDNDFLNASQRPPGYAVFGKVTQGFDVIQKMATKKTKALPNGMRDIPVEPIIITKATLIK